MLLVKTYIAPSKIHGIGLFASEPIAAGTVIWRFTEGFDALMSEEMYQSLPEPAKEFTYHHSGKLKSGFYLVTHDGDQFINYSETPNSRVDENATESIAIRDIAAGEEITENYGDYCCNFAAWLESKEHGVIR